MNNTASGRQTVTTPGTLDAALAHGRELLKTDPAAALQQAQAILKKDGREPRALRIAAAAHRAIGESTFADRAEVLAIQEARRYPALQRAAAELQRGNFPEASRLTAEHLRVYPDDLAALTMSAESALGIGLTDKAIPLFRAVLKRAPSFSQASVLLINALMLSDQLAEAQSVMDDLLASDPDNPSLLSLQNRLYNGAGKFAECVETTARLVALSPDNPDVHADHGDALRFAGRKKEALSSYRAAVGIADTHARSWWSMADLDATAITDADLERLTGLLASGSDASEAAVNIHFAAALASHERGNFEQAFEHFAAGNALRDRQETFDSDTFRQEIAEQLRLAKDGIPPHTQTTGKDAILPVFMVGMPRSGSTLLERMLANSDTIQAMGELQIIPHMVKRLEIIEGRPALNARIAGLSEKARTSMGEWYRSRLGEFAGSDTRVAIDKMHMNWRHLSFILRILPEARIIDIRRDGMDCCWSNFRTLFSRGHAASNSLEGIGQFYRSYVEFMDAMRRAFPDRIMHVEYEALVDKPERVLGEVCEFLGVGFDPAMLDFHRSSDPVATASSEQVRQPLNTRGIGAWQSYEPFLAPLQEALRDG